MREAVHKLRHAIPDITLRTSLIVGFPGETEEDFQELLDFVQEAQFDRLGVFKYSMEEGTAAALMGQTCTIYMGVEDMRRQRLNVDRMSLLGA